MKTKIILCLVVTILTISLLISGCSSTPSSAPAPSTPVVPAPVTPAAPAPSISKPAASPTQAAAAPKAKVLLRGVSFLPKLSINMVPVGWFAERVTEQGKGDIAVQWVGGPDVIPAFDQMTAVRNGVIDISFSPMSYYGALLPETNVVQLSAYDPAQDRQNGIYDYMAEIHKKVGVFYLGRFCFVGPYIYAHRLWLNKPIKAMADLKGLRIRSGAVHDELLRAVGAVPVTLPWPEVYSAATRGVIDGAAGTGLEYGPQAYAEMFKYSLNHAFYDHDLGIIINMGKWNSLTKEQQQLLTNVNIGIEKEVGKFMSDSTKDVIAQMVNKFGMKEITFSKEEGDKFYDLAYSSSWATAQKLLSPEVYAKLRKLMAKEPVK